jgi:hypothetical protein
MSIQVCPASLAAMTMSQVFLDGVWVVESTAETETRSVHAVYTIETAEADWQMDGQVQIENKRNDPAVIRYRQRRSAPDGMVPVVVDGDVCWDWATWRLVASWEWQIDAGEVATKDIDWAVRWHIAADVNLDGIVDGSDRGLIFADWGTDNPRSDLNRDGKVNGADVGIMNTFYGWKLPDHSEGAP